MWVENLNNFIEYVDTDFQNLEFQLVMYDEVEYFKKYNNPEFNYPY